MFDVTNFLMRWLFLCNLVHDIAEIQTLPYTPHTSTPQYLPQQQQQQQQLQQHPSPPILDPVDTQPPPQHQHQAHQQQQHHISQQQQHGSPPPPVPPDRTMAATGATATNHPPTPGESGGAMATTPGTTPTSSSPMQRQSYTCEEEWRDHCLRAILSYPPGTQRVLVLDALRAELVQRLNQSLKRADETIRRFHATHRRKSAERRRQHKRQLSSSSSSSSSAQTTSTVTSKSSTTTESTDLSMEESEEEDEDDPYLDADLDIIRTFVEATGSSSSSSPAIEANHPLATVNDKGDDPSEIGRKKSPSSSSSSSSSQIQSTLQKNHDDNMSIEPSAEEVEDAQQTIRHVRDYLPQLVSVVLKSPPASYPNLLDPIQKLRRLVVERCMDDANWGIDMCWLLEAEVGRAWKTLFEHRQQTGKRLIVVLPAEKAAVLAKIGTEKRDAFDLLQDAEQATAYGYTVSMEDDYSFDPVYMYQKQQHHHQRIIAQQQHLQPHHLVREEPDRAPPRLPSSLSLRRCSHFGDTMHFIDRLTRVSLDLRHVPTIHRHEHLQDSLRELNRRLRRRMVTSGDVSLDVEDGHGPDDWPRVEDISSDMLKYSVHLPLEPLQQRHWPGGLEPALLDDGGAVRVLDIVVEECRILSSRERCPFLVRLEVAETGLQGNDGRLYAAGVRGLGATVEEALAISVSEGSSRQPRPQGYAPYKIPSELVDVPVVGPRQSQPNGASHDRADPTIAPQKESEVTGTAESRLARGGWQADEAVYYPQSSEFGYSSPYDDVRQNEYEELHHQLYSEQEAQQAPPPQFAAPSHFVTTREALLDKVFGQAWLDKCEEIRQASPYGKTKGWRLASFIIKAGEDIRREALVMQIVKKLNGWFEAEIPLSHRPHLRPYTIMCVGGEAGLVECLSDAKSIDEVKKTTDSFVSLRDYFERAYGPPTMHSAHFRKSGSSQVISFEEAQENFLRSLVGYSLICYILQIKDRHNANILLDREGNIMHIDFGFILGDAPKMAMVPLFTESAPFKLSVEFWEVLGGWNVKSGGLGVRFCHMFEKAFASAANHSEEIVSLVEASLLTLVPNPRTARHMAQGVRNRLRMRGAPGSVEQKTFIMELVNTALLNYGTKTYDWLQRSMNGYQ